MTEIQETTTTIPTAQPIPMSRSAAGGQAMDQSAAWAWVGILSAIVLACYGNTLWGTAESWTTATYNHGYLIPLFGLFLIWQWRRPFVKPSSSEVWAAAGIIVGATIVRVLAARYVMFTIDRLTFLACLAAIFLFVGGLRALKWAGPGIAFSVFMFPWPGFFTDNIMRPMQTIATMMSAYSLQTLGIDAYQDGNRIMLENVPMNVAEQCSGLRMLTIFIALSVAMAMISSHRPMWERLFIVLSSVPIALIVNAIRITLTGYLMSLEVEGEAVHRVFHDFAGLIMMPLAIGLLFLEMSILARVMIDDRSSAGLSPGLR